MLYDVQITYEKTESIAAESDSLRQLLLDLPEIAADSGIDFDEEVREISIYDEYGVLVKKV